MTTLQKYQAIQKALPFHFVCPSNRPDSWEVWCSPYWEKHFSNCLRAYDIEPIQLVMVEPEKLKLDADGNLAIRDFAAISTVYELRNLIAQILERACSLTYPEGS